MDPFSITTGVAELLPFCIEAVGIIKNTIETLKNAKPILIKLMHEAERMRLLLDQTITELKTLVSEIAKQKSILNLQVLLRKPKANHIIQQLRRHEQEIVVLLLSVATQSSLKTEAEVEAMTHQAATQSEVISAFDDLSISQHPTPALRQENESARRVVWPACMSSLRVDPSYLSLRHRLADASFYGRWDEVWETLALADTKFGQNWVNFPRLKLDPSLTSGWTPLHQAVYLCASEDVIRKLIRLGALKTIRTLWTDNAFTQRDLTPFEMARELGYAHLYHLLIPTIKHFIPITVLDSLQLQFHEIIRGDIRDLPDDQTLRLPELLPLTELEIPLMELTLNPPYESRKGYLYRLDGRELLVLSYGFGDSKRYRVSINGVLQIEDAIVLNNN